MTQGIQHSTRPFALTSDGRLTRPSHTTASRRDRQDHWLVKAFGDVLRLLIGRGSGGVPSALVDDVGSRIATPELGLRAELNRLDASLHARIY